MSEKGEPQPGADKLGLEEDIRVLTAWQKSVNAGTFPGSECASVAGLQKWFKDQLAMKTEQYEAAMAKNAAWGRPSDIPEPAAVS